MPSGIIPILSLCKISAKSMSIYLSTQDVGLHGLHIFIRGEELLDSDFVDETSINLRGLETNHLKYMEFHGLHMRIGVEQLLLDLEFVDDTCIYCKYQQAFILEQSSFQIQSLSMTHVYTARISWHLLLHFRPLIHWRILHWKQEGISEAFL